jgi:hypothetical protein
VTRLRCVVDVTPRTELRWRIAIGTMIAVAGVALFGIVGPGNLWLAMLAMALSGALRPGDHMGVSMSILHEPLLLWSLALLGCFRTHVSL